MSTVEKKCSQCGEEKHVEDFYHLKTSKDGYMSWCKQCHKQYGKKSKPSLEIKASSTGNEDEELNFFRARADED